MPRASSCATCQCSISKGDDRKIATLIAATTVCFRPVALGEGASEMNGVITGRELVSHFRLIWREFGLGCLVRCVACCLARRRRTFLEIAWESRRP